MLGCNRSQVSYFALLEKLEKLQRIPLYDEEYQWYSWSGVPRETGALEGMVQVETDHAITDKFAAKRFEILVDGARGNDTYNVIKAEFDADYPL